MDFSQLDDPDNDLSFEENLEEEYSEFIPQKNFDYSQLKEGLNKVLDELPESQRTAIMLYYLEEFKIKEIAEIMAVSEGTVKSYLNYGRKTIKNKIENLRKKNESFYSIAPVPFLIWMLQDQSSSIPGLESMATHVLESLGGSFSKIGANTTAAHTVTSKVVGSTAVKTISTKTIAGILAVTVGIGAVGGYAVTKQIQTSNQGKQTVSSSQGYLKDNEIEETSYSILDSAVSDFDFVPIKGVKGYCVCVDGKYGLLSSENEWIEKPHYEIAQYQLFGNRDFQLSSDSMSYTSTAQDSFGIYHEAVLGSGVIRSIEIKEESGNLKPYVYGPDESQGLGGDYVESDFSEIGDTLDGMAFAEYEGKWYLIDKSGNLYGPYEMNEMPCYDAFILQNKNSEGSQYVFNYTSIIHFDSIFYQKEEGKYRIFNHDASKKSERLYDKAIPISNDWMQVEYNGKTIYIDNELNEYYSEDFDDLSCPIGDKAYAKIGGEWKYIQLKDMSHNNQDLDKVIKAYKKQVSDSAAPISQDSQLQIYYSIYDVDQNGIPELFIKSGHGEVDYMYYIYTYEDRLINLGETSASQSVLEVDPEGVGVLRTYGHMGKQTIDRITIENQEITTENIFDSGDTFMEEYIQHEMIPYYDYDDDSGFKIESSNNLKS